MTSFRNLLLVDEPHAQQANTEQDRPENDSLQLGNGAGRRVDGVLRNQNRKVC